MTANRIADESMTLNLAFQLHQHKARITVPLGFIDISSRPGLYRLDLRRSNRVHQRESGTAISGLRDGMWEKIICVGQVCGNKDVVGRSQSADAVFCSAGHLNLLIVHTMDHQENGLSDVNHTRPFFMSNAPD